MNKYQQDFYKKYKQARVEKQSILCAGFDPAFPDQRPNNTIPTKYLSSANSLEDSILAFFSDFLAQVKDHCCAIKPNNQYIFHIGLPIYQKINRMIHDEGLISILDLKIGDIGSTNQAGFYWIKKMGFDAATYNPFSGNIEEAISTAHSSGLGIFTLTLMSNPEARFFMKENSIKGQKGYEFISDKVKQFKGDGVVVGATDHVTENNLGTIRQKIGKNCVMLIPGIGKQKGDLRKVILHGGDNILLNVGRAILYSENIGATAQDYNKRFNDVLLEKEK
ncbi:MAG: orotidine 5'-phosphate decarboxylase [Asgard group archaeon]|nr:orotidine 5'-phosphate decarboxylase [Asgard group archaeon]